MTRVGTAWTRVQLPAAIGRGVLAVDGVAATSATDVWAAGSGVILHWDGRSWTCYRTPNNLLAVSASSAGNAWAAGFSGYGTGAVTLHWNGHRWKQVMIPQLGQETTTGWKPPTAGPGR